MKREFINERRQAAGRMEAMMVLTSGVALVAGVLAFLSYGWLPGITLLLIASVGLASINGTCLWAAA